MANIFLHSKSSFDIQTDVNVILSPEFYWLRIFELPMSNKKDILSALPSLFEDFIDVDGKKFYAKKLEDKKYLCFAYDELKIIDAIKKANLKLSKVKGIYFAQIEFASIMSNTAQSCLKIDGVCLGFNNSILVQVPIQLQVSNANDIDISFIPLSKDKISVNNSSKYLDAKLGYTLSILFVLFAILNFAKVSISAYHLSDSEAKIEEIKQKYNMPQSSYQTKSIVKKLKRVESRQIRLRKLLAYIFEAKRKNRATLVSLKYNNKLLEIKFKGVKAKTIVDYLEKKYSLKSAVVKDKIVDIKVEIK